MKTNANTFDHWFDYAEKRTNAPTKRKINLRLKLFQLIDMKALAFDSKKINAP